MATTIMERLHELETTLRENPGDHEAREAWIRAKVKADPHGSLPHRDVAPWVSTKDSRGREWLVPAVGVGATHGYGSDAYPFTVVEVSKTGHQLKVRRNATQVVSGTFRGGNAVATFATMDGAGLLFFTRSRTYKECEHCGRRQRVAADVCHGNPACRDATEARGARWLPVYQQKGATGRLSPSLTVGLRRYWQDPHF